MRLQILRIFWMCQFSDFRRPALRRHGVHNPRFCGYVLLWRSQRHSPHLFKVVDSRRTSTSEISCANSNHRTTCLMFGFITMVIRSTTSTFCRLFYAGAVQGQMPEILSMIQVCLCLFTIALLLKRKNIPSLYLALERRSISQPLPLQF